MKQRTRKIALASLIAAMTLSCGVGVAGLNQTLPLFATVNAEEVQPGVVAKVGEASFYTFAEALEATKTATDSVTVEIYDKVTWNTPLLGSYENIAFVGKSEKAEIYLDVQGYLTANGKKVSFTDLKLSKSAGGYVTNAGFMNVAFGVNEAVSVAYTNCTFVNGSYANFGAVTYENCTFNPSHDEYGLWAYGNADVTVNNCVFTKGGVKMYSEGSGANETATIEIKESDFNAVVEKPAIVLTKGERIELVGNEYPALGVIRLDGTGNGTAIRSADPVTCVVKKTVDGQSVMVPAGVVVDGKIYETVAQANDVAQSGSVVTLLHDSTETVALKDGVQLNTNGYTAENVTATATLNAVAKIGYEYYETFEAALAAVKAGDTLTLMNDVTIASKWDSRDKTNLPMTIDGNNKTLKFTGEINDGYNYLSAFSFISAVTIKDLTIDMSEAISVFQNRFSAISARADVTVENCTFIGSTTYTNARAIIFGEGSATTGSLNVSVSNCEFTNWGYGVVDDMNRKDSAKTVTITDCEFNSASALLSATESVVFSKNEMDKGYLDVSSYTNTDNFKVTALENTLADNGPQANAIKANPANITTDEADLTPVAKLGEKTYFKSMESLLAYLTDDKTITLTADLTLFQTLTLPADVTFNGNGYTVNGSIVASGNLTFASKTVVTSFNAGYNKPTITIGEGASLEMTTGRMVIGHGATFNVIGSIADAKTVDVATIQPSLILAGASFTGAGVTFNATNAYISVPTSYSSGSKSASGTFEFNFNNSVWNSTGKFEFNYSSTAATVDFEMNNCVFNTGYFVFGTKGNVVINNSNVNVGAAKQIENRGTMTIKNGSVVHAINNANENAFMPGTLIVDNATYVGTGELTGGKIATGLLILKNKANVTLNNVSNTKIYQEQGTTLKYNKIDTTDNIYAVDTYTFTLKTNKTALKANEHMTVTVAIDKDYYSAEYTFTYDTSKFTCAMDNDGDGVIFVSNLYKGQAGDLATYAFVAKNDIQSVYEGDEFAVSGNVVQYKEQLLNGVENPVVDGKASVKISLNYTANVKADYVQGYSLVLVKGDDAGYAYNNVKMFYVEAYEAYAVIVAGKVTAEDIDAALSKATDCEVLKPSYNVNAEYVADGKVDLKDATMVYACTTVVDFAVADYMELYLRADVNGDGRVNVVDINSVVKNYTK